MYLFFRLFMFLCFYVLIMVVTFCVLIKDFFFFTTESCIRSLSVLHVVMGSITVISLLYKSGWIKLNPKRLVYQNNYWSDKCGDDFITFGHVCLDHFFSLINEIAIWKQIFVLTQITLFEFLIWSVMFLISNVKEITIFISMLQKNCLVSSWL